MASSTRKLLKILGSAVSIAQPKFGVDKTPELLQSAKIEELISKNAKWVDIVRQDPFIYEEPRKSPIRNIAEIGRYNKKLYKSILSHARNEDFFLTIGGDHSVASTSISALLEVHQGNLGVIWLDAHGDCNTPITTLSGNYHGMPLSHLLGLFKDQEHLDWGQAKIKTDSVAMLGIRDLDRAEKQLMDAVGVKYFSMEVIRKIGIKRAMDEAMNHIDPNGTKKIHLSLDVDAFGPELMPGTGTVAPEGLNFEDYDVIIDKIHQCSERFTSMDLVEINFEIEKEVTMRNVKELLKKTFSFIN